MTNRFYSLESHFGTAQNSSDLAGALLVDVDGRATAAPRAVPRAGGAVAAADAAPAPRAVAAAPAPAGRGAVARGGRAVAAGGDAVARAHAAARTAAVVVVAVVEKISAQISRPRMSRALKSKIKMSNVLCFVILVRFLTVIVMVGVAEDHRGEHSQC